jgi:hypothetical protein
MKVAMMVMMSFVMMARTTELQSVDWKEEIAAEKMAV